MAAFDVVIIGNGVLGMTLGLELARREAAMKIAIVGSPLRPGSASLAAGAMINVWGELDDGALEFAPAAAKFFMGCHAIELWDQHAQQLSEDALRIGVTWGSIVLDTGKGLDHEARSFDYLENTLAGQGMKVQHLSPDDMPFLSVHSQHRSRRAMRIPDGFVDSRAVMQALQIQLARLTAIHSITSMATSLKRSDAGVMEVHVRDGESLSTRIVVLANGAYAQGLIDGVPELKESVPHLFFGGGSALQLQFPDSVQVSPELEQLNQVVRTLERGNGHGIHLIPQGARSFYFGSSSHIALSAQLAPIAGAIFGMLQAVQLEINQHFGNAEVSLRGVGQRAISADTFPLLGESALPGIWFCTGARRDGFTCSPFIGQELAKAILNLPNALPELFRPSRPLISYRSRAEAIAAAAQARVGQEMICNSGLAPDQVSPAQLDRRMQRHRREVTEIYDRRGIGEFGIAPELLHLYDSDESYRAIRRNGD